LPSSLYAESLGLKRKKATIGPPARPEPKDC